jgi:Putative adhesin
MTASTLRSLPFLAAALALPLHLAAAQQRRADFHWDRRVSGGGRVSVHNISGDVTVLPSSSGRVEVTGTKRGNSRYFGEITAEVKETRDGLVICVVRTDSEDECDERGLRSHSHRDDDDRWGRASMDLEVRIPGDLEVSANSVSGDVSVAGAQGDVRANSVSGDIKLDRLRATSVHANTVSGDVTASIESLGGRGDLSFKTVSGDVVLTLPRTLDADLSMSSVSGHLDSDYELSLSGGRMDRRRIEARIGRGGRELAVSTVSGDVRLRSIR